MEIHMINPLGVILLVFGLPGALWPYKIAKFEEQVDSIGSKRDSFDVGPADWKVLITRVLGVLMTVVGVLGVLFG